MKKMKRLLTLCLVLVLMLGIMAMPASAELEREYVVWTEDELKDLSIPRPDTDGRYVELYVIPANKNTDDLFHFLYDNEWENCGKYAPGMFVVIMDKDYGDNGKPTTKLPDIILEAAREAYDRNTDAAWKAAIAESFGLDTGNSGNGSGGNTTTKPETPVPTTPVTPVTPPVTTTPTTPTTGTKPVTSFSDVKPGDWYYDAVMALANSGIIAGYGDGRFGPNQTITAGELATIMCRIFGLDTSKIETYTTSGTSIVREKNHAGHDDTTVNAGHWAEGAMSKMQLGTATGDWGMCIANMQVNRGWAIDRLANELTLATWPDGTKFQRLTTDEKKAILNRIPDVADGPSRYGTEDASHYNDYRISSITEEFHATTGEEVIANNYIASVTPQSHAGTDLAAWKAGGIALAYAIGLVNGVDSSGRCNPWAPITRAQVVQMLYNVGITQAGQLTRKDTSAGINQYFGFGR